jgi:hypothetical protein
MQAIGFLFAYFGPETVMPVTSILATAAAVVMMFGKTILRFTLGRVRTAWYRVRGGNSAPAPHFIIVHRRKEGINAAASACAAEEDQ